MAGKAHKKAKATIVSKSGAPLPEPPADPLPPLEGCVLELDWRDFKGLLEAHTKRREQDSEQRPPLEYVLGAVAARGSVGETSARLACAAELDVVGERWTWIPLVSGDVALSDVSLEDADLALHERSGQRGLLLRGPRKGKLAFALQIPLLIEAAQSGFSFGLPEAPVLELDLTVPGEDDLDLAVEPSVHKSVRREGKASQLQASVPAPAAVRVSWTVSRPEAEPAPQADPVIQASVETLALVGEGNLRVQTQVRAEILRAPVRSLTLEVPGEVTITDVRSPNLAQWDTQPGTEPGAQQVRVLLDVGVEGRLQIELDCDRQLDAQGAAGLLPARLQGAVRDQGHIAVVPLTNVDVSADEFEGARRVDPRELPPSLRARAKRAILHAFHYAGTEPRVPIVATKHPDLPVITTVVERAQYLVMVTEDGQGFVQGRFTVRNAQQQFLRMSLGEGERLLSALLSGEPVKPAQDDAQHVLIPLKRAGTPEEADTPFSVEAVTMATQDALSERGALQLRLPSLSLPVAYLTCELHLPRGYVYDDFTGTLREVDRFQNPIVTRADLLARSAGPPEPPKGRVAAPAPAARARAMVQQAMAPPAPPGAGYGGDPFGAAEAEIAYEAVQGEELQAAFDDDDGGLGLGGLLEQIARPEESGRLPIRIDIPEEGERFRFERILSLGEELELNTEYAREKS